MSKTLQLKILASLQDKLSAPLSRIRGASGQSGQSIKELRDRLKNLETTQKDVGRFREMSKGLSETSSKLQAARQRANQLGTQFANTSQPTAALRREFQQATRQAAALKQEHRSQSQNLQQLRSRLNTAGVSTRDLSSSERQLRTNITQTNQALKQQQDRLGRVAQQQRRLEQARSRYQKTQALTGSMATAGAAGVATGSAALYAGGRFMGTGIQFDQSMSQVQALARIDKNSPEMKALRAQARQLGAETQFTATDAASGQGFLAMAGFDPKAIQAAMPGMLDIAKAGGMELAQTADIASNILTGFKIDPSEMGRVGDVLVGAFTQSNVDLTMLGETMKYAAPIAANLGQDIETIAAMAGKLGDAGIQGGMAGTAMRSILNRMSAPPAAAEKAIKKLGLQTADSMGNLRPMPDLLAEIYEKTKHMGDTQRAGLLKAIAGEEAVSALQILVGQAGEGALQAFIETLKNTEGEASATAKTMADNLAGDLDAMRSGWEDLGIGIEEQQDGVLRSLVQRVTGIIRGISAWAERNPELVSTLVRIAAAVAVLIAAGGALTLTLASILGPIALLRYSLAVLGIRGGGAVSVLWNLGKRVLPFLVQAVLAVGRAFLLNPIGLFIAAVSLAAYAIYRYWEPISAFFGTLWEGVKVIFNEAVQEIKAAIDGGLLGVSTLILNWSPMGLFYSVFAAVMDYFGVELPSKFTEFGSMIMSGLVTGIRNMSGAVKDSIVGIGDSAMGWFKDKLGIQSPSRVFMGFGENVSEGAAIGIRNRQSLVANATQALAAGLLAVGSLSSASATPTLTVPTVRFANQSQTVATNQVVRASGPSNRGVSVASGGDHIEIHIHASAGMDERALARLVAAELDKRDREKQARQRSSFNDY